MPWSVQGAIRALVLSVYGTSYFTMLSVCIEREAMRAQRLWQTLVYLQLPTSRLITRASELPLYRSRYALTPVIIQDSPVAVDLSLALYAKFQHNFLARDPILNFSSMCLITIKFICLRRKC